MLIASSNVRFLAARERERERKAVSKLLPVVKFFNGENVERKWSNLMFFVQPANFLVNRCPSPRISTRFLIFHFYPLRISRPTFNLRAALINFVDRIFSGESILRFSPFGKRRIF